MDVPVILYIEDDTATAVAFKVALESLRCDVNFFAVENSDQALAFLRRQPPFEAAPTPSLMVLDLLLPGETGLELIENMRHLEQRQEIPIVVFTGWLSPDIVNRARELGAREVFRKPMDLPGFSQSVEKICQMLDQK